MSNFSALKTAVQQAIKQNGNEEITGAILQEILLSIINTLGDSAINNLETALQTEATNRTNADGTLQQNINSEATARGEADTALSNLIGAEETARANADTALQGAITTINARLNEGYLYKGIATPTTDPSTPTGRLFYIATAAGTYTNFLDANSQPLVVTKGINILKYNGSWEVQQVIAIDETPTVGSHNLVESGGVQNELALGAVYDVSAKNPTAGPNNDGKFESLSALLSDANLNTLIPTAYRKGGMSIKYVQTSDNNYVQYRYMLPYGGNTTAENNKFVNVGNWQGVDDVPTAGSQNLVKSGGVKLLIDDSTVNVLELGNFLRGIYVDNNDVFNYNQDYCLSDYIPVRENDSISWHYGAGSLFTMRAVLYDNNGEELDNWVNNAPNFRNLTISADGYIRVSFLYANISDVYVSVNSTTVYNPLITSDRINALESKINNKVDKLIFGGNGNVYVYKRLYGVIPGNRYRLNVKSTQWQHTAAGTNLFILGVESYLNSTKTDDLVVVRQSDTVSQYYDFTAVENDYVDIGIRADVGETVILELINVSMAYANAQAIAANTLAIAANKDDIEKLKSISKSFAVVLDGHNSSYVSETKNVTKGKYIVLTGGTWGKENVGAGGALFAIEISGKTVVRCNSANKTDLQDYYFVEFSENSTIEIGARADLGTQAIITLVNMDCVYEYLLHNKYITEFDNVEGKEFLFLGKSFVQADALSTGTTGNNNNYRVSQSSLLEVPYPKAKLKFKLPNYVVAKMTFGDFSFQLNTEISWISNGQVIEVPEKVLYYRLTFAKTNVIKTTIGEELISQQLISVADIQNYINNGEIAIIFDNVSVFSSNALQEQYLKTCLRKYDLNYSSNRDKGFNYFPTILHLTDVHGDVTRIRRALQYAKMLNVETVVLTGDIVCGDTRNNDTFIKDIEDETGTSIYPCVGNHDSYGTSIYDNGGAIGVNPAYRQWNTITKNVLTKEGVVSPAGVDYPTYYHYDDSTRKLRYIFVNLYEKGRDYTYSGALYVSSAQINWLIDTLASTPQDYGVILLMHQAETGITKDNDYAKFYGVEGFTPQTKITGTPFMKIIDAFIGKTSVSDSYTQYVNGIDGEQETIQYTADFSSIASGVEFIAYLTGHEHFDKIGYVTGATHKQLMLNITCTEAGYGNQYVSAANISELPRENGSTQDAITIYVIDREDKTIRLARLGSIITSKFEMRDYMVIPYAE